MTFEENRARHRPIFFTGSKIACLRGFVPLEEWEKAFDHATGKYGDLKVAIVF